MSEVRGKCDFCINGSHPQTWAPCPHCRRDHHRVNWRASAAGEVALRIEADLASARAELQRVREALDNYSPGAIRERWMSLGGFVPQSVEDALPTICQTADTIRAALDQEAKPCDD